MTDDGCTTELSSLPLLLLLAQFSFLCSSVSWDDGQDAGAFMGRASVTSGLRGREAVVGMLARWMGTTEEEEAGGARRKGATIA